MLPIENHENALEQLLQAGSEHAFLFTDQGIVVDNSTNEPLLSWLPNVQKMHFSIDVVHLDGKTLIMKGSTPLNAAELADLGYCILSIRAVLNQATSMTENKIVRAYHWLNWDAHSRYCGKCGSVLTSSFDKPEKRCAQCDIIIFPKASPAVMVLLHRKNELLLARSPHFQPGVYSAIAGFVEIGESAEEAARRETYEELGLKIGDLRYFSSQTWPFPDSFMMAFTSSDPQGELILDATEIEDAKWFNVRNLPTLPTKASISRRLIESTVQLLLEGH
ncbi:MAG: NAD(+) diphosphatase [Candidatus Berkiella sp.]